MYVTYIINGECGRAVAPCIEEEQMYVEKLRQRTQTAASARREVETYVCPKFGESGGGFETPPHV